MSSNGNQGFGRYLTADNKRAAEAKSEAAQQRRERIAGSIRGGYARYDRDGNAVDPEDGEAFEAAMPRTGDPAPSADDADRPDRLADSAGSPSGNRGFGRYIGRDN
jgi:hypothetical protein